MPTHLKPRRWQALAAAAALTASLACDRTPPAAGTPPAPPASPSASALPAAPVASASTAPAPLVAGKGDARIPFEFPEVATNAKAGDYVLAPPRAWIDAGLEKEPGRQTYIYYGGWMRRPGPGASEVETLAKSMSIVPNALIVAIPSGQRAEPGQLVLTSWASGTGMQRAIAIPGGTPESPTVRYLDMSLDNPTGWGERPDRLPANTFKLLDETGDVGTTAACREGSHYMRYIVVAKEGDLILGYGFAGKIAAFKRSDCRFLPLKPRVKDDESIYVPVVGRYVRAKVRRVDAELGRIWAAHKTDQEDQVTAFAALEVARDLE